MLTFWGSAQRFCDGICRRNFLRIGALGAGLTLADLLRLRAASGTTPRPDKSAVLIYLRGGPSHIDTYDLKPNAPVEIRGEFKPIATRVPGVNVCELLPKQAAMMDKLALVRSITGMVNEHEDSHVMTGYTVAENRGVGRPSFGAVVSKLFGDRHPDVPPFVSLRGEPSDIFESSRVGLFPGYLGRAHGPFVPHGSIMRNLSPATGITAQRLDDRKALLARLDTLRRDVDASGTLQAMDAYTARAFDMIASSAVRRALDLSQEPASIRERYKGFEQLLTARRLVEAGVGCVTVSVLNHGWDHHIANFKMLRQQLPEYDQAVATFIEDLQERGMDRDVVTISWGEFGRDPRVNDNQGGRHHWTGAMSALIAGGGLKMGQAIGSTDSHARYPKDKPYRIQNILSTLYHVLGIDPAITFPDQTGRPMYLLDDREPVAELL